MALGDFNLTHWRFEHVTKDYDIWVVTNVRTREAVMMRRWGKKGQMGQIKTQIFAHERPAFVYAEKVAGTRRDHGYETKRSQELVFGDCEAQVIASYLPALVLVEAQSDLAKIGFSVTGDIFVVPQMESPQELVIEERSVAHADWGSW